MRNDLIIFSEIVRAGSIMLFCTNFQYIREKNKKEQIIIQTPPLVWRWQPHFEVKTAEKVVIGTQPASYSISLIGPNTPGWILLHEMSSTPLYLGLTAHELHKYPLIIL